MTAVQRIETEKREKKKKGKRENGEKKTMQAHNCGVPRCIADIIVHFPFPIVLPVIRYLPAIVGKQNAFLETSLEFY